MPFQSTTIADEIFLSLDRRKKQKNGPTRERDKHRPAFFLAVLPHLRCVPDLLRKIGEKRAVSDPSGVRNGTTKKEKTAVRVE